MADSVQRNEVEDVVLAAIIDVDGWRVARLDEEAALTVMAVVSDDPERWSDLEGLWSRYWTPTVPEFMASLGWTNETPEDAISQLAAAPVWLVVDLTTKRIITGLHFQEVGRDQAYAMVVDDNGEQYWPLSIHLAPWWELHEQCDVEVIQAPRDKPVIRPQPDRSVLYGQPLVDDLARRILDVAGSTRWPLEATDNENRCYDLTIEVHRDWLMTPREDLGGLFPRAMLHGAMTWVESVIDAQRISLDDRKCVVAKPEVELEEDRSPMGRFEVCTYFELCRELIGAGWKWCRERRNRNWLGKPLDSEARTPLETTLRQHLMYIKTRWMDEPHEAGGGSPNFAIDCCRRRVPLGSGMEIRGMDEQAPDDHLLDCDCPICAVMAEGDFGPSFVCMDGHHLELDDEFAFSLCETREEWDEQQAEYREWEAAYEASLAKKDAAPDDSKDDAEFEPMWPNLNSDFPLPGDNGVLSLAFKLADIVGHLQMTDAPVEEVRQLNETFKDFRLAEPHQRVEASSRFKNFLQRVGERYPELVSKSADLQSHIDECLRGPIFGA